MMFVVCGFSFVVYSFSFADACVANACPERSRRGSHACTSAFRDASM